MSESNRKPVIFLAFANDRDETVAYLRNLPDEARRLRDVLQHAEQAGLCELVVRSNCTAADIFKVFQAPQYRDRIAIFHYGGHANGYQLLLESPEGKAAAADAGGLAAFLARQQGLQLVFLNGCSTQPQTQELLDANIAMVISTSRSIDDKVATEFSCQFYQGLAGSASIRTAFEESAASVRTARGGDTRALYFGDQSDPKIHLEADRWPWSLYLREGSANADQWNLPDAVNDPLFGLPPLPEQDLPESPYRHLSWFRKKDAEVFFGRGHQIRKLFRMLTTGTQPIILFYGQSGVGKSSLLDAGVIPRLESDCEVRYLRRHEGGLLDTLQLAFLPEAPGEPVERAWQLKEEQLDRPLIVFLDQVEECFTQPIENVPHELEQFLEAVEAIFSDPKSRPKGRLVLGFRKEWLAEIETQLVAREVPRTKVFLEPLDRRGIIEVVRGPVRTNRLRERYGLTVEDGLAEVIADDLLEDRGSAVAPTLQILLTKMWSKATEVDFEHPQFTLDLYLELKRDGILLRDFLNHQFAAFQKRYPEEVDSGLLLDIIALHTTPLGTAGQCSVEQLRQQYAHLGATLPALLQQCQDLHLLTVAASSQQQTAKTTRLAHDTLAPIVRERFDQSDKPGQRARRILDNRSVDWEDERVGAPLDQADLKLVEQGVAGTRAWSATEQRLVRASIELRSKLQRNRKFLKVAGAIAVIAITLLGAFGWWSNSELVDQTREAKANAREANRQKSNAFWQIGLIARDQNEGIKAGFNFLEAARACEQAGTDDDRIEQRNIQVAAHFATSKLIRTFPHDARVAGVQMNGDRSRFLAWSGDGEVKLWGVGNDEPLQVWKEDRQDSGGNASFPDPRFLDQRFVDGAVITSFNPAVRNLTSIDGAVFSADGSRFLSWSRAGAVKFWDVGKEQPIQEWKHDTFVIGGLLSDDDSRCLSWSGDGAIKLWDVTKSKPLQTWKHESAVVGAVFTGDQSRVLAWSGDGAVKLWDVKMGEPTQSWKLGSDVRGASFSRDESRVIAWDGDGEVVICDVENAEPIQVWKHGVDVRGAVFKNDGNRILTWSSDGEAKLWELNKDDPLQVWSHGSDTSRAVFTRGNDRLLTWNDNGSVKLWDLKTAEPLQTWQCDSPLVNAVFSRDESRVLAWSIGGEMKLWEETKAEPIQIWKHDQSLAGAMFTSDETGVLAWSDDNAVKLWDVNQDVPVHVCSPGSEVRGVRLTQDESRLLCWGDDGTLQLWDLATEEQLQVWENEKPVEDAVFARDESRVLAWSGGADIAGVLKLWDVTKSAPIRVWPQEGDVFGATFTNDDVHVLTWGGDGEVKMWDVTKDEPIRVWKHDGPVRRVVLTEDELRFLAWGGDGKVKLWDINGYEALQVWDHNTLVFGARFNDDESRVLSWSFDGSVRIWDVTKDNPQRVWKHGDDARGALFNHDETQILTWGGNGLIKLWDTTKDEPLRVWNDGNSVSDALFSHNESRILSWSDAGVLKLWDRSQSEPLQVWKHDVPFYDVMFTGGDSRVLGGSYDGTLKLWDVTKAEPLKVWRQGNSLTGARLMKEGARTLTWGREVALWNTSPAILDLTPTQRIMELEVRSASRLDSSGQLSRMKSSDWGALVRSSEYSAIREKFKAKKNRLSSK